MPIKFMYIYFSHSLLFGINYSNSTEHFIPLITHITILRYYNITNYSNVQLINILTKINNTKNN